MEIPQSSVKDLDYLFEFSPDLKYQEQGPGGKEEVKIRGDKSSQAKVDEFKYIYYYLHSSH